jgi:hypothetical protein
LEGNVAGRINLLVRKPRRDIKEIPFAESCVEFPSLAPPKVRRSTQDIGDRVLLSMVMDCCASFRFDQE